MGSKRADFYWKYRTLRRVDESGTYFGLYSVKYTDEGKPVACSRFPLAESETVGGLIEEVQKMLSAAQRKDVLALGELRTREEERDEIGF